MDASAIRVCARGDVIKTSFEHVINHATNGVFFIEINWRIKKMVLKNLKGTYDYLPTQQKVRQEIINILQDVFERFCYQPIETPMLCYGEVLASKYGGGAEILKEVYKVSDQNERALALRYDLTIPFAKLVGMNPDLKLPFKRYEIGRVFRDGPIKKGRNREFIQCDVDVVGIKSVMAEAELITMAAEVYKKVGLDVYISYNNRKLLSGLVEMAGVEAVDISKVILSLDKVEKIGYEGVESELIEKGIDPNQICKLFNLMKIDPQNMLSELQNEENANFIAGYKELKELEGYLDVHSEILRFSPGLARGLEIYTGAVWEIFLVDQSITSSVGAGGRYDKIIGAFIDNGQEYPAVGMTFGLDVMYEAMKLKGGFSSQSLVDYYIIPLGTEMFCIKLVAQMRTRGLRVEMDMTGRKLKKSLDYANKVNVSKVIIVGENEMNSGIIKIKDMKTGAEWESAIDSDAF